MKVLFVPLLIAAFSLPGMLNAQRKLSKKNGKVTVKTGDLTETGHVKDHMAEGIWITYYPKSAGKHVVKSKTQYKAGYIDGSMTEYFPDGSVKLNAHYSAGRKMGRWQENYENGKTKQITSYFHDTLNGDQVNFDANGKRRLHETYDRGILTGHQEWNERGILVKADFFSAGQKNGRCYWNAAGLDSARVSYCDYFNGQKNGEERLVDSDGTITVTFYSLDVRNGTYQRTSSSGKLQETGMYDNGRKIGLWVQADATGARTLTYYGAPPRSGGDSRVSTNIPELIGFDSCVSLYPNGRVRMIQRVKDRKNEFYTAICYDTNGVKNAFGFYRKDKRDSLWTTYYPNKKVSSTLRYYTGTPRGVYQAWYPSGKLMFKVPLGGDRVGDYLTFYDDKGREQPYNTKEADDVLRPFFWPNTDVHWQKFEHQGESTSNGEELFTTADVMPEFPGGMEGLSSFLQKNIQYPEMAREAGVQGKVFISFNILKDGSVSDVKVEKSADPSLDKEAVRVVKMMPRWNPGKQNGKPVAVHMTLPVNFSLR